MESIVCDCLLTCRDRKLTDIQDHSQSFTHDQPGWSVRFMYGNMYGKFATILNKNINHLATISTVLQSNVFK